MELNNVPQTATHVCYTNGNNHDCPLIVVSCPDPTLSCTVNTNAEIIPRYLLLTQHKLETLFFPHERVVSGANVILKDLKIFLQYENYMYALYIRIKA